MLPSGNGLLNLDPAQRDMRKYQPLANQEGAEQVVPPHFRLRGKPSDQKTTSFDAGSASGTVKQVEFTLPASIDPPEWVEFVLINHADAAVSVTVNQTVNDFVNGSGTVLVPVSSAMSVDASVGAEQVLVRFPFSTDGPVVVTFSASATMTAGGNVGAQLRYQG